jgi:CxxC motif-containing protein (DUF1111 family)
MQWLGAPPRLPLTPNAIAGRGLFQSTGCANCHVPVMRTGQNRSASLRNKEVWLYSDLLLHDMGALGDGIAQGTADVRDMKTAPLWGLRESAPICTMVVPRRWMRRSRRTMARRRSRRNATSS